MTARSAALLVALALGGGAAVCEAQLSPGPLSRAHADLEGSTACLRCHAPRRGVDAERCLSCHQVLGERIAAGRGLHASPGHQACGTCHIEHQGRAFELIWWGEAGRAAFDHDAAGWALDGAHAEADCRSCHRRERIVAETERLDREADLERTFLGLGAARCADCHRDPHDGRLGESCETCHGVAGWRPVPGFDHAVTAFPLTGSHRTVACADCHPAAADGSPRLAGIAHAACADCHDDPHRTPLGGACADCHTTASWRTAPGGRFDHDATRFPLAGAHLRAPCAACHPGGGLASPPRFAACADCHRDPHLGQFADRADGGRCDACHDLARWTPSTFGAAAHQAAAYPLEASHRAVPCADCHRETAAAEIPGARGPGTTRRFRFAATACVDCHADPHRGEVDRWIAASGCAACHDLSGWRGVDFDHDLSRFPLEWAHTSVACADCHRTGPGAEGLRLTGLGTACADCHDDPHGGQFDRDVAAADCAGCHGLRAWAPSRFDHATTRFALAGAHRSTPCAGCHRSETRPDGPPIVRYRGTPTACDACHVAPPAG